MLKKTDGIETVSSSQKLLPMRIIQITDCHLGVRAGHSLLGIDTDESLVDVLRSLAQHEPQAEFVIASGDVASEADLPAYERFLSLVQTHFNHPVAWLSGNHDLDAVMRQFPAEQVRRDHLEFEHWQVILLNSSVPGEERGEVQPAEIERLRSCLDSSRKHTLVFVHHQPVPVGCAWIDQYVISNAGQLLDMLSAYPQVKALVWGHVHQEFNSQHQHFSLHATPSTCIQFKPHSVAFTLDNRMPGYRWFELHADGRLETGVERVAEKAYGIDFASAGY